MDLGLAGKRALITGSTAGVGAAIAARLAGEGASVIVHGRDLARAEARAAEIRQAGGSAKAVAGDLGVGAEADAVVSDALSGGRVDILVANTGPFAEERFLEADDAAWVSAFESNVLTAVRCARGLVPPMVGAGWGRVVTLGTRGVSTPLPNMAVYSAAKAALANATGALARDLSGTGVTANTVSPGVIATDGLREMFERRARAAGDERDWAQLEPEVAAEYAPCPAGRLGTPQDIAAAVAFLTSPLADFITGSVVRVDGGIDPSINP